MTTPDAQDVQEAQPIPGGVSSSFRGSIAFAATALLAGVLADLKNPISFNRNPSSNLQVPYFLPVFSRNQMEMTPFFDAPDSRLSPDLIMHRSPSALQYTFNMPPMAVDA